MKQFSLMRPQNF